MKRSTATKIFLIALLIVTLVFAAVSCSDSDKDDELKIVSIKIDEKGEFYIGDENIDLSQIGIVVTMSDKTTQIVPLDDSMIKGEDRLKFSQVGTYSVTVTYEGVTCSFQFEVKPRKKTYSYLASFYPMGGTDVSGINTDVISAFPLPTREGYSFDGWYTKVNYDENTGKVEYEGLKSVEPYALKEDTKFYAKWIDNRVYEVKFYDGTEVVFTEMVHHGEKIDVDSYAFPEERMTDGRTFTGWNVINGNKDDVTGDLIVRASFDVDKCIVNIEYANPSGAIVLYKETFDYGTEITVGDNTVFSVPQREGYTSRFVVYKNHAEDDENYVNEIVYEELPENNTIVLTEDYTLIRAKFTIKTYKIIIWNGKKEQNFENLKDGKIVLERTYEVAQSDFTVDWNTGFLFSEHTQDPDISQPAVIRDENDVNGYKAEWCYVIDYNLDTEKIYNSSGLVWNEEKQIFEDSDRAEGETDSNWTLKDAEGNYIAKIINKQLTAVQADVTVMAHYTKRLFNVTLVRKDNGQQIQLATFKVRYLSDINVYDYTMYPNAPADFVSEYPTNYVNNYVFGETLLSKSSEARYDPSVGEKTRQQIEKLYLKENTDLMIKDGAAGYYITNEEAMLNASEEDWVVEWFTDASYKESSKVDFLENGRPIEVGSDLTLYCRDTDNRKYEVIFYYGYNFSTGSYQTITQDYYTESETVVPPSVDVTNTTLNGVNLQYKFDAWYDSPFDLFLVTGHRGNVITDFTKRKATVYYYAHYTCDKEVLISFFDKTQSTAFIGITGENAVTGNNYEQCGVSDNTIQYRMPLGSKFNMDMLFKGVDLGDGTKKKSGQDFYDNYMENTFYADNYGAGGNSGLAGYLSLFGDDTAEKTENLGKIRNVLNALIDDYKSVLLKVYAHDYTGYSTNEFLYYVSIFNDSGILADSDDYLTDLVSEYQKIVNKGSKIRSVLDENGYDENLLSMLGDVDGFIDHYADFLYDMFSNNYEKKHTNNIFIGINCANIDNFSEIAHNYSAYKKLVCVCTILELYINFLDYYKDYTLKPVTPRYVDSKSDLNNAYGFDGVNEVKYSFSGWYTSKNYTTLSWENDTEFVFGEFTAALDVEFYAKWTDITKGPEGLVYEEVLVQPVTGDAFNAYILVDYTNASQFTRAGYNDSEVSDYYYVTRDDNGSIPTSIVVDESVELEVQIPATIDKYIVRTEEAVGYNNAGLWGGENGKYKEFYVLDGETYVQATADFRVNKAYYKKEIYPVIGVKTGAFDNYGKYIKNITIPLNLYILEEGAFRGCNILTFNRTQAKANETPESYVILDGTKAIYQNVNSPYSSAVGKAGNHDYNVIYSKTIIAYANASEGNGYSLTAGTERIGAYAFNNSTRIVSVTNTQGLVSISGYAFSRASALTTLGDEGNKINVDNSLTYIGDNCFEYCTSINDINVKTGSNLTFLGENAFINTNWLGSKKGIVSLRFTDNLGRETGIILGYDVPQLNNTNYDLSVKYDIYGNQTVLGEYYGYNVNDAMILMKSDGTIAVSVKFNVRYITQNAFKQLNAISYTFAGVKEIGDRAFNGHASLTTVNFLGAYYGEGTDLGRELFAGRGRYDLNVNFPSVSIGNTITSGAGWNQYIKNGDSGIMVYNYD